jgi:flagellar protein FlaF
MSNSNKPTNPYANAAGVYEKHARKNTPDQRELEGRILLKAAQNFVDLQNDWPNLTNDALNRALIYNRKLWLMFVDMAIDDKNPERPRSLRSNIANLGAFIFRHSIDIQAKPEKEKLDILIEINRQIATGLMTKPKLADTPATEPSSPEQPGSFEQHSA